MLQVLHNMVCIVFVLVERYVCVHNVFIEQVDIVRREYLGQATLQNHLFDRSRDVICATGPGERMNGRFSFGNKWVKVKVKLD